MTMPGVIIMYAVRPELVVDLDFRPEMLEYVILECEVDENRVAERADRADGRIDRLDRILLG